MCRDYVGSQAAVTAIADSQSSSPTPTHTDIQQRVCTPLLGQQVGKSILALSKLLSRNFHAHFPHKVKTCGKQTSRERKMRGWIYLYKMTLQMRFPADQRMCQYYHGPGQAYANRPHSSHPGSGYLLCVCVRGVLQFG